MDKLQTENSHPDSNGLRQRSEAGQNTEDLKDQEASEKSNGGFVVQKVSTQFLVIELILVIFFMALYFYGQPR
jgi:hypothetical protein